MDKVEEILSHFGVKGMHWGVKRSRTQIDSSADHTNAAATKAKLKKGGTKTLSNKELQDLVTRMNLEQQLNTLKAKQPSKFAKGKGAIQTVLGLAKTAQEIHSVVNGPLGKEIRKALTR